MLVTPAGRCAYQGRRLAPRPAPTGRGAINFFAATKPRPPAGSNDRAAQPGAPLEKSHLFFSIPKTRYWINPEYSSRFSDSTPP